MESLHINATDISPAVHFDRAAGIFQITGRSLLDDGSRFYQPVKDWLHEYAGAPCAETNFKFKLEYLNIDNSKQVLDLLKLLEKIPNAHVSWHITDDEEDLEEVGQDLKELTSVPFHIIIDS